MSPAVRAKTALLLAAVLAASMLSGCGWLTGSTTIFDLVWLRSGDIYYQTIDDEGHSEIRRRAPAGSDVPVHVNNTPECGNDVYPELFSAPDGALGVAYFCGSETVLMKLGSGSRLVRFGRLPAGWGNLSFAEDSTGIAMRSVPSLDDGLCRGINAVRGDSLAAPFPPVTLNGHTVQLGPPNDSLSCSALKGTNQGPWFGTMSQDGRAFAFLLPSAKPNHTATESDDMWLWAHGAKQPSLVGSGFRGVDSVSMSGDRVVVSFAFGGGGISVLDLRDGRERRVSSNEAANVTFAPDGHRLCYVEDSARLAFINL